MIEELTVRKMWFVSNEAEVEKENFPEGETEVTIFTKLKGQNGYKTFAEIPEEKAQKGVIFQAYQFTYQDKSVSFERDSFGSDFHYLLFSSEEEAEDFRKEILSEMEDKYWDDKAERSALIDLGYDVEEGEDFSEISLNEDRRWNDYLGKWYLRHEDDLGYKMHYNNEVIKF